MKMPRSHCEAGNVQFVQELAEIDGPFEAPININFRDLTKLELPALVWNRSDACPRKMKITNTGHTVIVSAKWKCERPYLTGGPLLGKYVFSQIHFHWGQTDCKGSEHQICGEEFPLEMHVAHFKTEYMTQESALREKDGMVVVVYLFKLQEEPNHSLKRIINCLPRVRQPSTSHAIDPRPIVSLCNPFTEDYFMYWGSVVTSTCAHILLWIICREPFGISKEQVCEFRKIMDSCQQPICKNSRDVQPLHKRNVFHVNASKHLDDPLLPIKKRLGCYCKESKDAFSTSNSCHCQGAYQNQEDVEGNSPKYAQIQGVQTERGRFGNQTFVVQRAEMQSVYVLKRPGSDPIKSQSSVVQLKKIKSEACNGQVKLVSKSCCFFPSLEAKKINNLNEKRKAREKNKLFNSAKAFSQIMNSLEALKNQTFKKLKKIESINQEIKEMKPFCQDAEDKKWIRKIEKTILKQKRFTLKSSQGCLSELKKLAKDCNFDKYFDSKLPINGGKMMWLATAELPCYETFIKPEENNIVKNELSKHSDIGKTAKFSSQAQKLIESFFEDIKESDDIQEAVTNDPNFKKIKSLCSVAGDSKSISAKNKGYITQKMFNLGNLGDRFFMEVTTEDYNFDENAQNEQITMARDGNERKNNSESEKLTDTIAENKPKAAEVIPLIRVNIPLSIPKIQEENNETLETYNEEKNQKLQQKKANKQIKKFGDDEEKFYEISDETFIKTNEKKAVRPKSQTSNLNLSTDSLRLQRKVTKKVRKSKKGFSEQSKRKSSAVFKVPSKKLHNKASIKKFDGALQKKNLKNKRKNLIAENMKKENSSEVNKEETSKVLNKSPKERKTKSKPKTEVEKTTTITEETTSPLVSPGRKKIEVTTKEEEVVDVNKNMHLMTTETRTIITDPSPKQKTEFANVKEENLNEIESIAENSKETFSKEQQSFTSESKGNESENANNTVKNKTFRATLGISESSYSEAGAFEDDSTNTRLKDATVKKDTIKLLEERPFSKANYRSLTDVSVKPRPEFIQRLQLESVDSRKKTNQETLAKKLKESYTVIKEPTREAPKGTNKTPNKEQEEIPTENQEKSLKTENLFDYGLGFSTEYSSHISDECPSKVQIQDEKGNSITQSPTRKNEFLEIESEETFEILHARDSERSFTRISSKDVGFLASDNKNFQTSVSCSTLKKNSTSRPHSAETLHLLKTNHKRKGKKRPHCSKINSRHYMRKNHSVLKKPSKPLHLLSLTDEEQLKILSVNVAKYIKQKLLEEKIQAEVEKSSPINAEKIVQDPGVPTKKSEEAPTQESPTVQSQKAKKLRIPVLKSIEKTKEKEKDIKNVKKPNTADSQAENVKKKPETFSPTRPVNNFIKLNKQMAATYKRKTPLEKEKTTLGTKSTDKTSKPKTKTQKKTKEKSPARKPIEESTQELQTTPAPATSIPSPRAIPRKEKQIKGSVASKKPNSNVKTANKAQPTTPRVEKTNEGDGTKGKSESDKPRVNPKEIPRSKKCSRGYDLSASETAENPNQIAIQQNENKLDKKHKMQEEIQSEALFKKELEYFITMQMYLNNKFSKSSENALHYLNSKLLNSVESEEKHLFRNAIQNLDFSNKDVIVVKKKNFEEYLSSCSELTVQQENFPEKKADDETNDDKSKSKKISPEKSPKELNDSAGKKSNPVPEGSEDIPSDSSYDCKISITLNTNPEAKETENKNEGESYEAYNRTENCNSQMTTSLEGSISHLTVTKLDNKEKESEMTLEMKQKLLEILEGEIKREMGISSEVSSGNSSEGLGSKADDSEATLRSQSGGSSSDNIETLDQISNSMKQYLTYLRQLPDESKDYEEFLLQKGDEAF